MYTQLAKRAARMPLLLDDFFNSPWNNLLDSGLQARQTNTPLVNISERNDDYLVSMAAPGLKKEDFLIQVEGNMLTISSEKDETKEEEDDKFTRQEYSYSCFERSFTLPDEVVKDKIDAKYKNGVLEIVLPKKEEAKNMTISKQIAVK